MLMPAEQPKKHTFAHTQLELKGMYDDDGVLWWYGGASSSARTWEMSEFIATCARWHFSMRANKLELIAFRARSGWNDINHHPAQQCSNGLVKNVQLLRFLFAPFKSRLLGSSFHVFQLIAKIWGSLNIFFITQIKSQQNFHLKQK